MDNNEVHALTLDKLMNGYILYSEERIDKLLVGKVVLHCL